MEVGAAIGVWVSRRLWAPLFGRLAVFSLFEDRQFPSKTRLPLSAESPLGTSEVTAWIGAPLDVRQTVILCSRTNSLFFNILRFRFDWSNEAPRVHCRWLPVDGVGLLLAFAGGLIDPRLPFALRLLLVLFGPLVAIAASWKIASTNADDFLARIESRGCDHVDQRK